MNKRVPWDELPRYYAPDKKKFEVQVEEKKPEEEARNFQADMKAIGTRVTFGVVVI
jgi:hypothetical protein